MHDLNIKYIAAKNFVCFGPEGIEIDLTKLGRIVLIHGRNMDMDINAEEEEERRAAVNGIGKSTIPDIIAFTWYGKVIKSLRHPKKVTQRSLLNRLAGKQKMSTEVRWGKWRAVRTVIPSGKSSTATLRLWESEEGLWDDEHEITSGEGSDATQKLIEDRIGMSFETFVNVFVFTDDSSNCFLEADGPTKREIVENLLSLAKYREDFENAKSLKNTCDKKTKELGTAYERAVQELTTAETRITRINQQIKDWEKQKKLDLEAVLAKIVAKKKQLEKSDKGAELAKYNEAQEKIKTLNDSMLAEQKRLDQINPLLAEFQTKQQAARTARQKVDIQIQTCDLAIRSSESTIKKSKNFISGFEVKKGSTCPTCLGVVDEKNYKHAVDKANEEIAAEEAVIAEEEKKKAAAAVEQAKFDTELKKMDAAVSMANQKIGEVNSKMVSIRREIMELSRVAKPEVGVDEKILESQIEDLKRQALEKKEEMEKPSPFTEILNLAVAERETRKTEAEGKKKELAEAENDLPYWEFIVKAFGDTGMRRMAVEDVVPALNSEVAHWNQFLFDSKYSLTFDNDLNDTIERNPPDGNPFVYDLMSTGQRNRLCLSVSQSFAYIMMLSAEVSPSVVFLDEVTTNIDPLGVVGIYNLIQELAKTKQVFVTTHDSDLLDMLSGCDTIHLVMKNGFTTISPDKSET